MGEPMPTESPDPTFGLLGDAKPSASDPSATIATGSGLSGATHHDLDLGKILLPPTAGDEIGWLAHYRVLKVLGHGGMGAVFQAEDTHLQRTVALKVILPQYAAKSLARDRFLREARACAALKNDHVVTIYQVGQDRDIPFLAMEYLQGQTLEDRLKEIGALTPAETVRIGREIVAGLSAAHAQGLIHRDIKPANVWLEAPQGRVKLLDFGLARPTGTSSGLTQTGSIVGTPEYMSPEQARGEPLDARTDLFSLGAVLYAMCAGENPFQGSSVMAILTSLAVDKPRPLSQLRTDVSPAFSALIGRLLEKKPDDRPTSADEVAAELEAIQSDMSAGGSGTFVRTQSATRGPTVSNSKQDARAISRLTRRQVLIGGLGGIGALGGLSAWLYSRAVRPHDGAPVGPSGPPIRVGVLHSRTGTMQISEYPVIDAVLLAFEEINENGGVLGRPVEWVIADGKSDEADFAKEAESLISEHEVCTIFGCWTSASRKAVVPVVERHNHLLFYPVQYEGLEQSSNVVYLGMVPNQQILPALRWLVGFENKRRWFLVGSDYVFPVAANAIIRDEAKRGNEIVGEEYFLLGCTDVKAVVKKIAQVKPDLIVSTINGDTNVAFFRELRRAGIKSSEIPTISFSVGDTELSALVARNTAGDYAAASYFHSLESPENQAFLKRFGQRYGTERIVSDAMQSAYIGVQLWAKAVEAAGNDRPTSIREAVKGQSVDAPQGVFQICPDTQHSVQTARVGRIDENGRLVQVHHTERPIPPEPFPPSRTRAEWLAFLDEHYKRWGNRWSNSGT